MGKAWMFGGAVEGGMGFAAQRSLVALTCLHVLIGINRNPRSPDISAFMPYTSHYGCLTLAALL